MTLLRRTAWICLVVAVCRIAGAAPPGELAGESLTLIANDMVTYRVRETHVKTGGLLPGKYEFHLKLGLWLGRRELKLNAEKYEGSPILPVAAQITDFRYTALRPGGQRHELDGSQLVHSGKWGYEGKDARYKGQWDTSRRTFRFGSRTQSRPNPHDPHLTGVWVPALVLEFPEKLKVEKGFSWGGVADQTPRRIEQLSYLQQWKVAGVEEIDGGHRLTLVAECRAEPDEHGQRVVLKRQVVYDTRRKLVVRASVGFESSGGPESETIELTMELDEEAETLPPDAQATASEVSLRLSLSADSGQVDVTNSSTRGVLLHRDALFLTASGKTEEIPPIPNLPRLGRDLWLGPGGTHAWQLVVKGNELYPYSVDRGGIRVLEKEPKIKAIYEHVSIGKMESNEVAYKIE